MQNDLYPFVNLPLPYAYDALEPYIDKQTMYLHHDRHLQTYIDNLNKSLDSHPELQSIPLTEMLKNISLVPSDIRKSVRNNGGGVYNHRFYFDTLANPAEKEPTGALADAINRTFGSFSAFKKQFKETALGIFGSGYMWLVSDNGNLITMTSVNQNTPLDQGLQPILTLDVWEHAYYLKHYNQRADYIDNWFQVVDWTKADQNYFDAIRDTAILIGADTLNSRMPQHPCCESHVTPV